MSARKLHKTAADAVASILRRRYPHSAAKFVATDLSRVGLGECTLRTAENLLGGRLSARSITRLALAYGTEFLLELGSEVTGETLEQVIRAQAEAARAEAARLDNIVRQFSESIHPGTRQS